MAKKEGRFAKNISIRNRKASHEYQFIDTYEAGIVLRGSEIKSIREGRVSLPEAHCHFHKHELYVKGMTISPYQESTYNNHDPLRERKLLLKQAELGKLEAKSAEKGLTIIPTKLYINSRGLAKMEIALAKGKKLYDKRESIKKKEESRAVKEMQL
ncbi:MAG: SsrA-binding protein SmpB [Bacteroidota bacterium]